MFSHLEDVLDEINAHVEAKAPEIDAIQRQNDDLVVKLQDASKGVIHVDSSGLMIDSDEKIEIGNARLRETKDK